MLEGVITAFGTFFMVVVIFALTYLFTRYVGGSQRMKKYAGSAHYITMLDQMILGQESSVALVKISGRVFFLGITGKQISLLTELSDEEFYDLPSPEVEGNMGTDFRDIISRLRDRKK